MIGIVAINIDLDNFLNKKESKIFFEVEILKLKISFLKYQNMAKTLPSWIIADKDEPGSSIPNHKDIIFKWAVLLTGINSVNPWIKPYKINFKYSKKKCNSQMNITIYIIKVKDNIKSWRKIF